MNAYSKCECACHYQENGMRLLPSADMAARCCAAAYASNFTGVSLDQVNDILTGDVTVNAKNPREEEAQAVRDAYFDFANGIVAPGV